jgi:hypothetical protein
MNQIINFLLILLLWGLIFLYFQYGERFFQPLDPVIWRLELISMEDGSRPFRWFRNSEGLSFRGFHPVDWPMKDGENDPDRIINIDVIENGKIEVDTDPNHPLILKPTPPTKDIQEEDTGRIRYIYNISADWPNTVQINCSNHQEMKFRINKKTENFNLEPYITQSPQTDTSTSQSPQTDTSTLQSPQTDTSTLQSPPTSPDILNKFLPWGDSEEGCVNRCFNTVLEYTKLDCETICKNCNVDDRCKWINTENYDLFDTSSEILNNEKFKIQTIPGKNNVIVNWVYDQIKKDKQYEVFKDNKYKFKFDESFVLIDESATVGGEYTFQYVIADVDSTDGTENGFFKSKETQQLDTTTVTPVSNKSKYEIYSFNGLIKIRGLNLNEPIDGDTVKNGETDVRTNWYLYDTEDNKTYLISNSSNHPMNSKWDNTSDPTIFTKYKLIKRDLYNFVIQIVEDRNVENGAIITKYEKENNNNNISDTEFFTKEIKDLKQNTEYKLSLYPLFKEEDDKEDWVVGKKENENVSDLVTFFTSELKQIVK